MPRQRIHIGAKCDCRFRCIRTVDEADDGVPHPAVRVRDSQALELSDDVSRCPGFLVGEFGVAVEPASQIANMAN